MSVYETEEEQVESIKRWWKENGTSVIAGLVIGLGGVFGWQTWNQHTDSTGEQGSIAFEQMMQAVSNGDVDSSSKQAELLRIEYESTAYADIAALVQAKLKLEQGDSPAARSQLDWVMRHTKDQGIEQIARLRLARILLSDGDHAAAAALLTNIKPSFAGEFAELRGDIAAANNDLDQARQAYQEAVDLDAGNRTMIIIKMDDLGSPKS
ncbi:MAG: tetratricopeptide repeat protein [Candidatus Polarisedimenticolaceae bacterium]|nr:tetratricopeptide repeat protein [Candidatus Polarisedimenticolaceae bacterium]